MGCDYCSSVLNRQCGVVAQAVIEARSSPIKIPFKSVRLPSCAAPFPLISAVQIYTVQIVLLLLLL